MKTTVLYSLILLTLLGVGMGCKKEVEEVKPPVVVSPPTSTTTPPVATTSTSLTTVLLTDYPPGCRIARTIYKTLSAGRDKSIIFDPETVTLEDGRKVEVSTTVIAQYFYDARGQITDRKQKMLLGSWNFNYTYTSTALYIRNESKRDDEQKSVVGTDTIRLNEQGYILRLDSKPGPALYFYNQQGQRLGKYGNIPALFNQYQNGNLIREVFTGVGYTVNGQRVDMPDDLYTYRYDTLRPNLPVIYQFEGKASRNLPIERIDYSSELPSGPVYRKSFTYFYDALGRVKRRITYGKALNPQWGLEDDLYGIGVTDFEYENCP